MPNRSWLAKAKSVLDIGGEFVNDLGGKEPTHEQWERSERKWRNRVSRPLPVDEGDRPYFGCQMHDLGVLGVERTPSAFQIVLDSINARGFAGYFADVLERPRVEAIWPVELRIEDPLYVRAARIDLRGGLRFADWSRLDDPVFLYDWFFEQDGRIQWIVQLWDHDPHVPSAQKNVYLMVDGRRAAAEDRCFAVFERYYGEAAAELYRDAVLRIDEKPIDFNVYDGGRHTEAYIRRRMAARGLTPVDFRPASPAPGRGPSAQG